MTDQPQNPNDPSDAVPPGTPPAEPPPAPQPASAPDGPVGADVGAAFSWATGRFGKYAGILIGLTAIVFAIRLVGTLLQAGLVEVLSGDCENRIVIGGQTVTTTGECATSLATTLVASLIVALTFGLLAWIATIGIYRAALKTTQGEAPVFGHLTSGENLGRYVIVAIVYGLAIGLGIVLCILPGIAAAFLFQLAPFYALDKGQGVGDAFRNSFRATTSNFGPALLMTIINIVAAIVGGILFGILTLVALPFAALFTAHMYRQFNREPIAS